MKDNKALDILDDALVKWFFASGDPNGQQLETNRIIHMLIDAKETDVKLDLTYHHVVLLQYIQGYLMRNVEGIPQYYRDVLDNTLFDYVISARNLIANKCPMMPSGKLVEDILSSNCNEELK